MQQGTGLLFGLFCFFFFLGWESQKVDAWPSSWRPTFNKLRERLQKIDCTKSAQVSTIACGALVVCPACATAACTLSGIFRAGTVLELCRRRRSISEDDMLNKKRFNELDANKDGFLSLDDVLVSKKGGVGSFSFFPRLLTTMDTNDDKKISLEEWKEAVNANERLNGVLEQTFKILDLNEDGIISEAELAQIMEIGGERKLIKSVQAAEVSMNKIDINGDGVISREEFTIFFNTMMKGN